VTRIWLSEFTYRKFTETVPRPLSMCSNFIFCSGLQELYQTIYRPFSTLLEHTRILVEGLHNSEQHIHVFTESKCHFDDNMETTKETGGHFGIDSQHKPVNMSQPCIVTKLELKCHRYLVFLWMFVRLFKEVNDTFHSDTVQCYVTVLCRHWRYAIKFSR